MRHDTTASTRPPHAVPEVKPSGCCGGGRGEKEGGRTTCASAAAALALLQQAIGFIETIDDASYAHPSRLMPGGTIGKHFRHVVDHFTATLAPLRQGIEPGATIEYDRRERNVPMETCRRTAVSEIRGVMQELLGARESASEDPVTVRVMLSADGAERDFRSTLGRELAFASHHAVHHHAMIQVIAGELGLPVPDGFGKAPATLNFEHSLTGGCSR
jgi:hypothetical protein